VHESIEQPTRRVRQLPTSSDHPGDGATATHDSSGHDAHDKHDKHDKQDKHSAHAVSGAHDDGSHGEFNWIHGFLGEKADVEPSLLWRAPNTPPPFLANLFNFAVFAGIVVFFGRKPLKNALTNRKLAIMKEIDAATKMREEASARLAEYEDKLQHIDDEIERIREDFRAQGKREKERILAEARERKDRMLRDARFMIDQEVRQMRIEITRDAVEVAIHAAERLLLEKMSQADHDRVVGDYVQRLSSPGLAVTKGGSA